MENPNYEKVFAETDLEFNRNEDENRELLRKMKHKMDKVKQGGGERSIKKHKAKH